MALLGLFFLLLLTASRLMLMFLYGERVDAVDGQVRVLGYGLRYDGILLGLLLGPPFLLRPWLQYNAALARVGAVMVPMYAGLACVFIVIVEGASRAFIAEYGTRPNYLFVEYLGYPREVLAMLSGTHLLELLVLWLVALSLAVMVYRWLRNDPAWAVRSSLRFCAWATPVALLLTVALVRSTLDHRPVNPSNAVFSTDALVNQLALNSPYAVLYAVYEHRRDNSGDGAPYGEMEPDRVMRTVLKTAGLPHGRRFIEAPTPSLHRQAPTRTVEQALNLVIILLESVGANHVSTLGGKRLTPQLDALASQGLWFDRLYATGIRSARGIEAVITGFTPTHLNPVIKLAQTQHGFFSVAELLRRQDYDTSFIYGGESHFDNMRRFFLNNGFETIIDENDYPDPLYFGGWGVSDEDLFLRAHEVFQAQGDRAFFSLVFTSSNHEPFDIPAGRVSEETGPDGPRETAIKYADFALGRFLELARRSDYWERTVFLVVADHSAHKWGGALVPVEQFRIPGVFLGAGVPARRVPGMTSQIDLLPTALSLIGLSAEHPAIGRDITQPQFRDGAHRAMMQFHSNQAYMAGEWIIVLQPGKKPWSFQLDENGDWIWDNSAPGALKREALAHALWGPLMIRKAAYRIP